MKRFILILVLIVLVGIPVTSLDWDSYQTGFTEFAKSVANALPFNTSVGLNWSDAYIGPFPDFGIGLTVGATLIPYDGINTVAGMLGIPDLAGTIGVPQMEKWGVPLPAYTAEARLGGFVLPFDAGIKVGYLWPEALTLLPPQWSNLSAEYLLIGGDVRLALLEDQGFLPALSIGGGYNYMKGKVAFAGITGVDEEMPLAPILPDYVIRVQDPAVAFEWQANVVDLKAQASKKLLVFTVYGGAGGSLSLLSTAGGGLDSSVELSTDGGSTWDPITPAQIADIEAAMGESLDVSLDGFTVTASKANGWGFRAFAGLSVDLWLLHLDVCGMYNFTSQSLGANVNLRVQM